MSMVVQLFLQGIPGFDFYKEKLTVLLLCREKLLCVSFNTHTTHFTSDTAGHQMCGSFSHISNSPPYQLGALQLNLNLTLFTWSQCQIPQIEDSVPRLPPPTPTTLQMPITNSRSACYLPLSDLVINQNFPDLLPFWIQSICQGSSQNTRKHLLTLPVY